MKAQAISPSFTFVIPGPPSLTMPAVLAPKAYRALAGEGGPAHSAGATVLARV